MTDGLVPPHGGALVSRLAPAAERGERLAEAQHLPKVRLTTREACDVAMIGSGAYSPLTGFMAEADYRRCTADLHLADGTLWPIPITLSPIPSAAEGIRAGGRVALVDGETDETLATMLVEERFPYDKRREATEVFRTDDERHPGVAGLYRQGDYCLAGPVDVLGEAGFPERFPEYARPADVRAVFAARGWRTIAAFQTRNPLHRSHEYLTKVALETSDGLFLHPTVGKLKEGDIPAEVRLRCYRALLEAYYPADRVLLRVYPMEMRYAGPREAVLHAILRQNFGCSHLCVGRDHAGVGDYYGPYDAQRIFDEVPPGELHLQVLRFDDAFWCRRCEAVASTKTCPHDADERLVISGTRLRDMLARGERPPPEFSRPEVLQELMGYYRSLERPQGAGSR